MGQQVFAFEGASRIDPFQVRALAWSADASTLAAADTNGNVRLWSIAPRTEEALAARRAAWRDYALGWHHRAAQDSERQRQWLAAAAHLTWLIDAAPADGSLYLRRGSANGQAERWAEAADDFGKAITIDRIATFETCYRHALLLRMKDDMPAYRKAVAVLLDHWANTTDAEIARRVLQAYLLDGEKGVKRKSVERLVEVMLAKYHVAVTNVPVPVDFVEDVRTYAKLRQRLNAVGLNQPKQAHLAWLYFPLVCARLGDEYQGPFWLGQAARQIEKERHNLVEMIEGRMHNVGVGWDDVLALDLLRREIDLLLKKTGH
jgi:hypothetical protein